MTSDSQASSLYKSICNVAVVVLHWLDFPQECQECTPRRPCKKDCSISLVFGSGKSWLTPLLFRLSGLVRGVGNCVFSLVWIDVQMTVRQCWHHTNERVWRFRWYHPAIFDTWELGGPASAVVHYSSCYGVRQCMDVWCKMYGKVGKHGNHRFSADRTHWSPKNYPGSKSSRLPKKNQAFVSSSKSRSSMPLGDHILSV